MIRKSMTSGYEPAGATSRRASAVFRRDERGTRLRGDHAQL